MAVINEQFSGSTTSFFTLSAKKARCYRALSGVSFQNSVDSSSTNSSTTDDHDLYDAPHLAKVSKKAGTVCVTFIQRISDDPDDSADDGDAYDRNNSSGSEIVDSGHIYEAEKQGPEEFAALDLSIFEPFDEAKDRSAFIYRPPRPSEGERSILARGRSFRDRWIEKLFVSAPLTPAIDYSGSDAQLDYARGIDPVALDEALDALQGSGLCFCSLFLAFSGRKDQDFEFGAGTALHECGFGAVYPRYTPYPTVYIRSIDNVIR